MSAALRCAVFIVCASFCVSDTYSQNPTPSAGSSAAPGTASAVPATGAAVAGGGTAPAPVSGAATTVVKPAIVQPLKDSDAGVTGTATPSTAQKPVTVSLKAKKQATDADFSPVGAPVTVNLDGTFTITHRLSEGEVIEVHQETGATIDTDLQDSAAVVVNAPDNERVAIDFLAGLLLSQGQQDFSQTNLFLSLNIDETFHKPGWYWKYAATCDAKHKYTPAGTTTAVCAPRNFPGLNGFFQTRLTAIPVTSNTTTTTAGSPTATTYDTFLASRKSAHFEIGGYIPWYFGHADVPLSAKSESFFVAPIARFGFNTLVDSNASAAPTTNAAGVTTQTTSTTQVGVNDSSSKVYSFGVLGTRIGTADMKPGSPRTVHYLDVSFGKFSNLSDLYCSTKSSCVNASTQKVDPTLEFHDTPWRLLVEGYMDIDGFVLGFSINKSFSWSAMRPGDLDKTNPTITRAADDARFLFGYKFDVNKLLNSVKKTSNF